MNKPRIFLSYSRPDAEWVRSFAEALKQRGVAVWLDEWDIRADESLWDAFESALRDSDVLVAVVASGQEAGPTLLFEIGAAIGSRKKVVPIIPVDYDPDHLPLNLHRRKYLVRETPEKTADELSHALSAA